MDYSGLVFGDVKVLKRADGNLEKCKELFKQGKTGNPIYTCECLLCGKIFDTYPEPAPRVWKPQRDDLSAASATLEHFPA